MPTTPSASAIEQLVQVVRRGLAIEAGDAGKEEAGIDTRELDAKAFVDAVRRHQVAPFVATYGEDAGLPPAVMRDVTALALQQAAEAMTVAIQTGRAVGLMESASVPCLVMKGAALSVLTTGTVTARGAGDVDLLVADADVHRAHTALVAAGWTLDRYTPAQLHAYWRWLRWSTRELAYGGQPAPVDLHWQVAMEHGLLPDARSLLARAVSIDVAGAQVRTAPTDALVAACYHLQHDEYSSLRQVIDVVRLLRIAPEGGLADERALGRRARPIVRQAAAFAVSLLGGVPSAWNLRLGIPPAANVGPAYKAWASHRGDRSGVPRRTLHSPLALAEIRKHYRHDPLWRGSARFAVFWTLTRDDLRPLPTTNGSGPVVAGAVLRSPWRLLRRRSTLGKG